VSAKKSANAAMDPTITGSLDELEIFNRALLPWKFPSCMPLAAENINLLLALAVRLDGLVSLWRGEERLDEMGGNNGTVAGNYHITRRARVGQAFVFDGSGSDWFDIGNPANYNCKIYHRGLGKTRQHHPGFT